MLADSCFCLFVIFVIYCYLLLFIAIYCLGSYDEWLRRWDERNLKREVDSIQVGGGVWRIKQRGQRFLVAAMHGGYLVLDNMDIIARLVTLLMTLTNKYILEVFLLVFNQTKCFSFKWKDNKIMLFVVTIYYSRKVVKLATVDLTLLLCRLD